MFENNFTTPQQLLDWANDAHGKSYSYHKTSYSIPVNFEETTPYELGKSNLPVIRLESNVNYYQENVDRTLDVMEEKEMPSIYARSSKTKKMTKSKMQRNLANNNNGPSMRLPDKSSKLIFSKKMAMSSYNTDKKAFPCLVELNVTKKETDILRTVLEDNNLFD